MVITPCTVHFSPAAYRVHRKHDKTMIVVAVVVDCYGTVESDFRPIFDFIPKNKTIKCFRQNFELKGTFYSFC